MHQDYGTETSLTLYFAQQGGGKTLESFVPKTGVPAFIDFFLGKEYFLGVLGLDPMFDSIKLIATQFYRGLASAGIEFKVIFLDTWSLGWLANQAFQDFFENLLAVPISLFVQTASSAAHTLVCRGIASAIRS